MELVLKTDISAAQYAIEFNFDELREELDQHLVKYRTMVVTKESVQDAKTDRATINKLRNALETERKAIKAACMQPYEGFEQKIKILTGMVDTAIDNIDDQIKAFEQAKKEEKSQQIKQFYDAQIGELGELLPLERLWNPKWLNVTFRMEEIEHTIQQTIDRVRNDIEILRAMQLDCETQVIGAYLKNLNMSEALAEKAHFEQLQKQLEGQKNAAAKISPPAPANPLPELQTFAPTVPDMPEETPLEQLDFRVWVTAAQKAALKQFLITNKIQYGRVTG